MAAILELDEGLNKYFKVRPLHTAPVAQCTAVTFTIREGLRLGLSNFLFVPSRNWL